MKDMLLTIQKNTCIAPDTYEMVLSSKEPLPAILCGQFLHIETGRKDTILRRPFCICKAGKDELTIIYAVVGKGTKYLADAQPGESLRAALPLGNGFVIKPEHKRIVLLGGGIGAVPLLMAPQCYPDKTFFSYMGFASKDRIVLEQDFKAVSQTVISTDDGSYGFKGYVTQALEQDLDAIKPDLILTCGTDAMIRAVAKLSVKYGIPAYMSGENRMGCGVGACLVCTCGVREEDGAVHNRRACMDGPVFDLKDLVLE